MLKATSPNKAYDAQNPALYANSNVADMGISLLHKGDCLYRMGESLRGVYMVNVGAIKLYRSTLCGDQQVIGFYMSGDIIGIDAIPDGISKYQAEALDTTSVTLIPFHSLSKDHDQSRQIDLITKMGIMFNRENDLVMMLSQRTAERKLAWFLLEYSARLSERNLCCEKFVLPMTRTDIALYLGLALETVCRELAHLEDGGYIKKEGRTIRMLDKARLGKLVDGEQDTDCVETRH